MAEAVLSESHRVENEVSGSTLNGVQIDPHARAIHGMVHGYHAQEALLLLLLLLLSNIPCTA